MFWRMLTDINTWIGANVSHEALIAVPALFVALLVPIAFFLMERQDLYGFDKNVILDKIILAKLSIPLVMLCSILLVFNVPILTAAATSGLIIVIGIVLLRVYKWMASIEVLKYKTTYKQDMRLKFIRGIKNETEKVDTWAIILNDEKLLEKNQRGLVNEFVTAVSKMKDGKNSYPKSNLTGLMARNIRKIDFTDIQSFERLVEYSIQYFQERRNAREKNKQAKSKDDRASYPSHYQMELAYNLLRIALEKDTNDIFDYLYFNTVKKYTAEQDVDEPGFIRDFLPGFINILKENEQYDPRSLWQELSDWIVTKDLLSNEETWPKSVAILNAYMETVGRDARSDVELSRGDIEVIDRVTEYLLPKINTSFWFDIVTLYNSGWGLDEGEDSIHGQLRSYASKRRSFGLFNMLGGSTDWVDDETERLKAYEIEANKQDEETIYILGLVYPWLRNPSELQKILDQIGILEKENIFEPDSREQRRLESIKARFDKMKSYTDKMITEQEEDKTKKKKRNDK